ncbi:MAG: hypothetical protein MUP21_13370 [Dehalococcoidia bacterium]|nr:hypothetical protein [Dehalococcoidia bacterium]
MRCPRCGGRSFDTIGRCRECGYAAPDSGDRVRHRARGSRHSRALSRRKERKPGTASGNSTTQGSPEHPPEAD